MSEATRLISALQSGDPRAADELLPMVYRELRELARARMAQERSTHTLQATALVHEAYLRLVNDAPTQWDGRGHFFAAAAEAMRRILIEHARRRKALKRGGDAHRVRGTGDDDGDDFLDHLAAASPQHDFDEMLALSDALDRLEASEPQKAELVKLLYFVGMTPEEAAAAMGISRSTVYRQWEYARAWLFDAINADHRHASENNR